MALEYNYNGTDYRAQIDYVQICPQSSEVHAVVTVFDKVAFDMRQVSFIARGDDFDALDALTANQGDQIGRALVLAAYQYVIATPERVAQIVAGDNVPADFVAPDVVIV